MTEFGLELHRVWFRGRAKEQRTYCGGLYKTPKHFSCGKHARLRMAKRTLIILNFSRRFLGKTFGGFSKRRIFAASFQKAIIARPLEGRLAQLVQSICLTSRGSGVRIPQRPPRFFVTFGSSKGRLAQLVQSICLTSRGSAVRIRQRPQIENFRPIARENSLSGV